LKMKKEGYPALLLLSAVLGLALASAFYLGAATCTFTAVGTDLVGRMTGSLFPLCLACLLGFSSLGPPFLALLTLLRSLALTLACYLAIENGGLITLAATIPLSALKLLIFASFCRLSLLFSKSNRRQSKRNRYSLQFFCDFLFFCGLSALLCILPCLFGQ